MKKRFFYEMPEDLRHKAVDLSRLAFYLSGYAWDRETILQVCAWCRSRGLAILGGEVHYFPPSTGRQGVYPGGWSSERQVDEKWQHYIERSYQESCAYLKAYPVGEEVDFLFEPIVIDETGYQHLKQPGEEEPEDEIYWASITERDRKIENRVSELNSMLMTVKDQIEQYLEDKIDTEKLIERTLRYPNCPEPIDDITYAEKLRADLIDYALGVILSLHSEESEQSQTDREDLEQLLRYLNGEEPFCGETIYAFN